MTILYSIGPDGGDDNLALRYSLRSLDRFAVHCDKVIVAGCPPAWLSGDAVAFPVAPNPRRYKQQNILDTILAVIDAGLVAGEFLYSSDDHFLISSSNFDAFPYYYKSDELPTFESIVAKKGLRGWAGVPRSLTQTRDLLIRNGLPARNWSGHVNTHLHTDDAPAVKKLVGDYRGAKYGYEPTCLFMNVRAQRDPSVEGVYRRDCKLEHFTGEDDALAEIGSRDTFSIAGGLLRREPAAREWLDQMYPASSRFER